MYVWLSFLLALLVLVVAVVAVLLHMLDTLDGVSLGALALAILIGHVPVVTTRNTS